VTPAQVQELLSKLQESLDVVGQSYRAYIKSLDKARISAEALSVAIKDLAAHPQIELQDFEIDG
jgi:hypothetical protein